MNGINPQTFKFNRLIVAGLLTLCAGVAPAHGLISPTSQADAANWLRLKVEQVEQSDGRLQASAEILKVFKSDRKLEAGDLIAIAYSIQDKSATPPAKHLGPGSTPPLRKGSTVYAFLDWDNDDGVYIPGAGLWSFAPPFGIPEDERAELGMRLPTPPSTPPPPPPDSMRATRGAPGKPSAPPPSAPPPPPTRP